MSNSTDLSPNPSHLEVLRSASCRMARDSIEEPSHGMARTAEAEAGYLGTPPGALPGADSLLGVAPSIDLLITTLLQRTYYILLLQRCYHEPITTFPSLL